MHSKKKVHVFLEMLRVDTRTTSKKAIYKMSNPKGWNTPVKLIKGISRYMYINTTSGRLAEWLLIKKSYYWGEFKRYLCWNVLWY